MVPSIAAFRQQMHAILASAQRRNVIVLAVDGIPYDLMCRTWRNARLSRARSVFPTTSSTAWLSALTGQPVDAHGIPGVVFEVAGELVDVYAYKGSLGAAPAEDLFSDAARAGYTPVAIVGDLERTSCTWRDWLVQRAMQVTGHEFFWRDGALEPAEMAGRVAAAVRHALELNVGTRLIWCFIDADRYIHHHGYDQPLVEFLAQIDALAVGWSRDAVVVAHSDHGLVRTRHDPSIAATLDRMIAEHGCKMGGAGRTRWLYVGADKTSRVRAELARSLPSSIRIHDADELFAPGSVAHRRVGSIVLVAEGESFLAADGYAFEHGSLTETELDVGVAQW